MKRPDEHAGGVPAFKNAGTARPLGRAQRMTNRVAHVDDGVDLAKIPRPKIRRRRPGPYNQKPGVKG